MNLFLIIGIGFAIPSNVASNIISQLIKYGETKRGWLGVRIQEVTKEIAEVQNLNTPKGALVAGVSQNRKIIRIKNQTIRNPEEENEQTIRSLIGIRKD